MSRPNEKVPRRSAPLLWVSLCLFGAQGVACHRDSWQEFRSKDGDFKVLLPGPSTTENLTSSSPQGTLIVHLVTVQTASETYTVAYNDYPKSVVEHSTSDAILDLAVEGALGESGRLVSSSPISLNKRSGRSVEAALPEGIRYRANFVLDAGRLYQVSVLESPGSKHNENVEKFLGSFQIGLDK